MSEEVTMPRLTMITSTVFMTQESLARDTRTHRHSLGSTLKFAKSLMTFQTKMEKKNFLGRCAEHLVNRDWEKIRRVTGKSLSTRPYTSTLVPVLILLKWNCSAYSSPLKTKPTVY